MEPCKACIMHVTDSDEPLINLTTVNLNKIRSCCEKWAEVNCDPMSNISRELLDSHRLENISIPCQDWGIHRKCYQKATNIRYIERFKKLETDQGESTSESEVESSKISRSKRLRRSGLLQKNVLPPICIICEKAEHFFRTKAGVQRDKLCSAETLDGGKVILAACKLVTS